jgi:putative ABC transport system permease protein
MYRGFGLGERVTLRGTEWTVVGVFTAPAAVSASVLHADAATVMSAFDINNYNEARVVLASPAAFETFKRALESDPAIRVDVKSEAQIMKDVFGLTIMMLNFIVYFIGGAMAFGAVCGALNSLYASVDMRRRELATLRAVGYRGGPIVAAVLIEGMLLALPGALLGAAIAWLLFNGHQTAVVGFAVDLKITPQMIRTGIFWALAIGLIGASLPALRVIRTPIAKGLQAV